MLFRSKGGLCILYYGKTDTGKTYSIGTLPGKTYIIVTEPKDPRTVLAWAGDKIEFFECEDFNDYMDLLAKWHKLAAQNQLEANNIVFDSLSFLMSKFKIKFEDDHFDRESWKIEAKKSDKKDVTLYDRFSMGDDTLMGWGGLASIMKRVTDQLNYISQYGKIVLATATELENPRARYDGVTFNYAPSFQGREYPNAMSGYFHLIGRIVKGWRINEDDTISPPIISFHSDDDDYVARSVSSIGRKTRGRLNWTKIINLVRGK